MSATLLLLLLLHGAHSYPGNAYGSYKWTVLHIAVSFCVDIVATHDVLERTQGDSSWWVLSSAEWSQMIAHADTHGVCLETTIPFSWHVHQHTQLHFALRCPLQLELG